MKKTALSLIAVLAFITVATLSFAGEGPEVIEINKGQKSMAPVSFKHHEHQTRVDGDCLKCHHTEKAGEKALKPCSDCHGKDEAAPNYKDAMHKGCQPCHKEQAAAGKAAPTKCKECHVKK